MKPARIIRVKKNGQCIVCNTLITSNGLAKCRKGWEALLRFLQRENPSKTNLTPKLSSLLHFVQNGKTDKAPMCSKCSSVINHFHDTYQTYEFGRLQLEQSLQSLTSVMVTSEQDEKLVQKFEKKMQPKGMEDLGNAIVAASIRKITLQKCNEKLKCFSPRVAVTRLESSSKVCTFRPKISSRNRKVTKPKPKNNRSTRSSHVPREAASTKTKNMTKISGKTKTVNLLKCNYCDKMLSKRETWISHKYSLHSFENISPLIPSLTRTKCRDCLKQVMKRMTKTLDKHNCLYCSYNTAARSRVKVHIMRYHMDNFVMDIKTLLKKDKLLSKSLGKSPLPDNAPSRSVPNGRKDKNPLSLSLKGPTRSKAGRNKHRISTHIRTKDKAKLWECPHCPRKFRKKQTRRNHLKEVHTIDYIFSLLSSAPYPCPHSVDTISKVVTQVLEEQTSLFLAGSPTHKLRNSKRKCPVCAVKVASPKRHIFQTHFHPFFTTVQNRLSTIEQQEMNTTDFDSSTWNFSLSPITLPDDFVQQVIDTTEEYNIQISDIYSTITDLD